MTANPQDLAGFRDWAWNTSVMQRSPSCSSCRCGGPWFPPLRPNTEVFADVFPFTPKALLPSPMSFDAYVGIFQLGFGPIILNTLLVALRTG